MKLLSRAEEIVLLAILKLKDTAYGVSIKEQIERETENKWSFGSIYMPCRSGGGAANASTGSLKRAAVRSWPSAGYSKRCGPTCR